MPWYRETEREHAEQAKQTRIANKYCKQTANTHLRFGADTARQYAGKYCSKPETAGGKGIRNSHLENYQLSDDHMRGRGAYLVLCTGSGTF